MENKLLYIRDLSSVIRIRRSQLKLSQERLAELVDCHVNHIARIERSKVDPSYTMVIRIALALKLSPKDLMPDS
jgi:transcriptional regulator with XRE-family HTH domain